MRSVTSGGQDLEQHVNSEIKRMATVQPSASIANVGNGLEMLGAKIGALGMKLEERKRAMAADRWETDLQIGSKNVLSNPDNVRAMKAGDYNKVRDELQKLYDRMNSEMETVYGIKDERTKFALGKARDVLYANTFASLNVNEVGYLDELQKGEYTKMMNDKENLEIHYMNSEDQTTANAVYQSYIRSLEAGLQDKLITPEEYQSRLRRIKRIRVTGRAERMVEDAYNAGNIEELRRLSVELDHSDYIYKLGGNGDERLGNFANNYLRTLEQEQKELALPKNLRDRAMYATEVANNSNSEDDSKIAEKANKQYNNFLKNPILSAIDANNVSYEGEDYSSMYFSSVNKAVLENYLGTQAFKQLGFDKADDMSVISKLKSIVLDNKTGETLYDRMDYSTIPSLQVGDVNSLEEMVDIYERKMSFMPYEIRRKAIMDGAKRMGYAEFDVINHMNMNAGNRYGGMLETANDLYKPNESNNNYESDYEVLLRQAKADDSKFKVGAWFSTGMWSGVSSDSKKSYDFLTNLAGKDFRKMAVLDLEKRCNAIYLKTKDKETAQNAFEQGMEMIMGNDTVVSVNDESFLVDKRFKNDINEVKSKGLELLVNTKIYQSVRGLPVEVKNITKTTNARGNIYFENIGQDTVKVCHRLYGDLYNENEELLTINLNDIRNQKIKEQMYRKQMPKGNYIKTTGSYY